MYSVLGLCALMLCISVHVGILSNKGGNMSLAGPSPFQEVLISWQGHCQVVQLLWLFGICLRNVLWIVLGGAFRIPSQS